MNFTELEELARVYRQEIDSRFREIERERYEALEAHEARKPSLRQRVGGLLVAAGLKIDPEALPVDAAAIEKNIALSTLERIA